jgi:hypothetical protein
MMKKIVVLLIALSTTSAWAGDFDDVTNAFGFKLRYFQEDAKEPYKKIDVVPEKENRFFMFTEYSLSVTPKTKKVYSINASGQVLTSCEEDVALIDKFLNKKYEFNAVDVVMDKAKEIKGKGKEIIKDKDIAYIYDLSTTRIYLTCDRELNNVSISYVDNELAIKSRAESESIFKKSINSKMKELEKQEDINIKGL